MRLYDHQESGFLRSAVVYPPCHCGRAAGVGGVDGFWAVGGGDFALGDLAEHGDGGAGADYWANHWRVGECGVWQRHGVDYCPGGAEVWAD